MEGVTTIVHKVTTRGLRFHQNSEVPQHLVVFFFFFYYSEIFPYTEIGLEEVLFFSFLEWKQLRPIICSYLLSKTAEF